MIVKFINNAKFTHESVSLNDLYLVLAVSFIANLGAGEAIFQILNKHGGISHVPVSCFDIVDGRSSAYWAARLDADGSLLLWPKEFFAEYFHDDLSDGAITAREKFDGVVNLLQEESGFVASRNK